MSWIDLTQSISQKMSGVQIRQSSFLESDGWNAKTVEIYSHAGTHMDAPIHFGVEGPTIDQWPLERLVSKALVIDCGEIKPNQILTLDLLASYKDKIFPGISLLLKTGWGKFAESNPQTYRNELPRISEELANYFVQMQVNMLGVEAPSVADVNNIEEVTKIHKILFYGQIIIIEGLQLIDLGDSEWVELIALPLKIEAGDGAPARVIAKKMDR